MADDDTPKNDSEETKPETPEANQEAPAEDKPAESGGKKSEDLDLDDELAEALGDAEGGEGSEGSVDIDALIAEEAPEFAKQMEGVSAEDFKDFKVDPANQSDEVGEDEEVPSAFRAYLDNMPKDLKRRYMFAAGFSAITVPIAILIYMGYLLPRFELPFAVRMDQITKEYREYPTDGVEVPLFDDFRSKAHTFALPQLTVNLKPEDGSPTYAKFEFFLNLRDKDLVSDIENEQAEILDLVQRTLEEFTLKELKSPMGKEKIKKVLRFRINDHLQANHVLGLYYRSVLVSK